MRRRCARACRVLLGAVLASTLLWASTALALVKAPRMVVQTVFPSRGLLVPATIVLPASARNQPVPLVIMAHGHGGTREEAGGFARLAWELAGRGIASVRMDFPGCGDSTEAFTENYLSNMLQDIAAARAYAVADLPVDASRVALLGYSMGARLAVLASEQETYAAIALWAAVGLDGAAGMYPFLGGEAAYLELKAAAESSGSAAFTSLWGDEQLLGLQWFRELETSRPTEVIGGYDGPLLVLHGAADQAVLPENSKVLAAAAGQAEVVTHFIEGADHGLGFYSEQADISGQVIDLTVEFLDQQLQGMAASGTPN